ncbi:uncharacterized mitochondrial protein AtMg00820-like [Humulus lupulus]|uniref:uncharacterized mitochondrial protein AtMg00820-like n=1 Tax=Humulus lupulus TaxID=3486 RepID=UPI002B40DF4F|nr:uncharacterized mitochondrial protein AtMg00820-like [Humulus lupulus]
MTTRSKVGIFKPKTFLAATSNHTNNPDSLPESLDQALSSPKWLLAMNEENTALINNKTWLLVPRQPHMHIVDNKWVYRIKYNPDGSINRYKACLVAKGFQQQPGIDFFETFSLVVKPYTIRVVLSLEVTFNWDIQ